VRLRGRARASGCGFDTVAAAEIAPSSSDELVLDMARREQRALVTEDKDLGWLVFVSLAESPGVVLLRFHARARTSIVDSAVALVRDQPESLRGSFTVVQPGRVRFSLAP
jgi:predicted nuclease of predicted toxin-antitoxin system